MSTIFPINPNAGGPDGDKPDPVLPDLNPRDAENSEETPDGAERGGVQTTEGVDGATSEDLPYSWADLDNAEAEQETGQEREPLI